MIETSNETWRTVEAWVTGRLEKYRGQLEVEGNSELHYAQLRAKITELKALQTLPAKEQIE